MSYLDLKIHHLKIHQRENHVMRNSSIPLIGLLSCLVCLISSLAVSQNHAESGDAYIRGGGDEWTMGNSLVERKVRVVAGEFLSTSLRNKKSGSDYHNAAKEINLVVSDLDHKPVSQHWTLIQNHVSRGAQGELQLDLKLKSESLTVTKHYIVYPGSPVIREWLNLANTSRSSIRIGNVGFLGMDLLRSPSGKSEFYYVTGGGNYNGSQLLKSEPAHESFRHFIDSNDGIQTTGYSGYLPLVFFRNESTHDGVAAGWDYLGHWDLDANAANGRLALQLRLAGYEKNLAPGEEMETPKAFVAAFSGGVDELGNQLLDWQYRYLWDFTNPDYFAKTRWAVDWPGAWVGYGGTPSADNWGRRLALDFRYIDLLRETGTDLLWDDAGWYDKWGSWKGPDWKRTTDYLRKHDMKWVLWLPTFLATPDSKVAQSHPDWLIPSQYKLEQSIPGTVEWERKLLDDGVKAWGDYQWRYDIAPATSANDTDGLAADQNFRQLLREFKTKHPQSGIDACYNGGRWISYGIARFAESGEYTDGGVGPYSAYYTSLIIPPDKLHNVVDFDHTYYQPATDRSHLSMNPTWYRDPGDGPDVEAIRKDWELYHYLTTQGVVGRWSHVFRPTADNDDPAWYFQRMNPDGSKGVIITKHEKHAASYFVTSRLKSSGEGDIYLGYPWGMNSVTTTSAAVVENAVYEDPWDGAPRFYGVPGQAFGPLNLKYQNGDQEPSLVQSVARLGARVKVESRFFGMEVQPNQPLVVTELGQYDPQVAAGSFESGRNRGTYTLSLVRAEDGAVLASTELDMSATIPDKVGFKYTKLAQPVTLDPELKPIVIYPKGLLPDHTYDVRAIHSKLQMRETGAKLMAEGIHLDKIAPGELILLDLPNFPGSGSDHQQPTIPGNVTKRLGTNLGVQGIEVAWSPAKDENWLSYYEVRKNGQTIGKAAKGTFFLDHSTSARGDIDAVYEVAAVDGDGNRSTLATAREVLGEPPTYEALGDFSSAQSVKGWLYEETPGDGSYSLLKWDNGGYEGYWTGSGLGKIGRIWMQPSASYDVSRTFLVPVTGTISTSGEIRKDPSAENGRSVFVKIMRNSEQAWPSQGWAEVRPDYESPTSYSITNLPVAAGDKLRFMVKHNGENWSDPIMWNPNIVINRVDK
jgi:hypothetical protein